jgi:hypothetical protein
MKNYVYILLLLILTSCSDNDDPIIPILNSNGLEKEKLEVKLGESVSIKPVLNTNDVDYRWTVNEEFVSKELDFIFEPKKTGEYNIHFKAFNSSGQVESSYKIVVIKIREIKENSAKYLSELIEYKPAPGRFLESFKEGDAEGILGDPKDTQWVYLGGFGGYVSAGFDHTILNAEGRDFAVYSNVYEGMSEPGIVMVSFDYNGNGKADDEWFELAGCEYDSDKTIHNYEITYTNPKGAKDVSWTDNQGKSGVIINDFKIDNIYPNFIEEQESVTFKGTLIENKIDFNYNHPDYGEMVWLLPREWGYAGNLSSEYESYKPGEWTTCTGANTFDIDWAMNGKGEKVKLPGVDFIKVYSATNANAGMFIGEVSTQVMGAADLSMLKD